MTTETAPINPEKTALVREYKHSRPLTACHWEPQGRFIYFGAEDNLIHRFELASGQVVSLAAHDSWVRAFGSSPDGEFLYTGGYDGRLIAWPALVEKPEPLRAQEAHAGWIRALAVSPNGALVASCGNDRLIRLWDAATGSLVRELRGHDAHVYNVAFLPDGTALVSCDQKGHVRIWSVESGELRVQMTVDKLHGYDTTFRADLGGARGIALHGDGRLVALSGITNVTNAFAGVGDIAVALVNVADGKLEQLLESKDKTKGTAWGIAYHPDGFWIGLSGGGGGGWLYFWKGDSNQEFAKFKLKNDGRGLGVSPDRSQLAVAHADMHLRLYSLRGA